MADLSFLCLKYEVKYNAKLKIQQENPNFFGGEKEKSRESSLFEEDARFMR